MKAPPQKARRSMEAGATGLIFGRNVWQRDYDASLCSVVIHLTGEEVGSRKPDARVVAMRL